ncbi:MAG: hypothetical protein OXI22_20630 [Defluviicoccus sp.]|nr:hypothetical protein [Defluviicoccus sp.]
MAAKTESKTEARAPHPLNKRTVRVKPQTYQPKKAELEEKFHLDASPEDVIRAAFHPARVVEDPDA